VENECITVNVDRITFHNEENGYYVLKASSAKHREGVTVVGNFGVIQPGEEIRVYGTWTCHPTFGMQFHAFKYTVMKPATLKGIEKYLGSGMIKGIGPATAKKLVDTFGMDTLEIIENNPEKLTSCQGIGEGKARMIASGWFLQRAIQDVMIFLQGHGISPAYATRIFRKYDRDAIRKVSQNPYILAHEVPGMGFKKADSIAAEFEITGADPRRIRAGILYLLANITKEGHLFLEESSLLSSAKEVLQIDEPELISNCLSQLCNENKLVVREMNERKLFYLPKSFRSEEMSVHLISQMISYEHDVPRKRMLEVLANAFKSHGLALSESQQIAVEKSLKHCFLVITGGPGTGKTTTLKAVVAAHKGLKRKVLLASPTGRAAKRLSEVSGFEAMTIHRLLEYSPQEHGFKRNGQNPLDCDTLVIDEASMIDMPLFYQMIQAVMPGAALILVGDADQLPSVGPGLVLNQLISSNVVPVVRLGSIFRQAESSNIVMNAHLINQGKMPKLTVPDGRNTSDCYFVEADDPQRVLKLLQNIVSKNLPERFGYDSVEDIQVLSPMNRGKLGAANLNQVLQKTLNPPQNNKNEIEHFNRTFRTGDKIIQLRNNYDLEVFNGDMGQIVDIMREEQEIVVDFPQGRVVFQSSDLIDVAHAYAVTVHKAQGSEYPAVVMLVSTQHYMMLQRNLIYTGLTRAKKTMVFLGSRRAIAMAVKNNRVGARNTVLAKLLAQVNATDS
jgi:exodeoxyribonuclease V alpha subunit